MDDRAGQDLTPAEYAAPTAAPSMHEANGRLRALWISDVHLGAAGCRAQALVDFLGAHECDVLYLVGDIFDGWKLRSKWRWSKAQGEVIWNILGKAWSGTQVYYVTGNHDEFLRGFAAREPALGNVHLVNEIVHQTADGRRLLVVHGDRFDRVVSDHRILAKLGDIAYDATALANDWLHRRSWAAGLGDWSLSAAAKRGVKQALNLFQRFEDLLAIECRRRGLDGVICGHVHHAEIRNIYGVTYYNCGDWVDSCTALGEGAQGDIELLRSCPAR